MSHPDGSHPLDRLATRQHRSQTYLQARRTALEPLRAERTALLAQLETELTRFIEGAVPDLGAAALAPFDHAAQAAHSATTPSGMAASLEKQSLRARQLCQRYERDLNIYQLADELPQAEKELAKAKASLQETARALSRLDVQLEPLTALNMELSAQALPPITTETAAHYDKAQGLQHYVRWVGNRQYRKLRYALAHLEEGTSLAAQLQQRAQLQTELLVREQTYEVQRDALARQRGWVEAFVTAWTSRLTPAQQLKAVQEAIIDQMGDPTYRLQVAEQFGRRWPQAIDRLYDALDMIDQQTRRFISSFDANLEAGRVHLDDNDTRRRLPGTVGT